MSHSISQFGSVGTLSAHKLRDGRLMEIKFPNKATIAELFTDDEKPVLPDGADFVEILALGVHALKLAIEESQLWNTSRFKKFLVMTFSEWDVLS